MRAAVRTLGAALVAVSLALGAVGCPSLPREGKVTHVDRVKGRVTIEQKRKDPVMYRATVNQLIGIRPGHHVKYWSSGDLVNDIEKIPAPKREGDDE